MAIFNSYVSSPEGNYNNNSWLVVWNHGILNDFPIILGMEKSSQLLLTHIFQKGWNHQPDSVWYL